MKTSLRQRIAKYLKANSGVWISGDEIEKKAQAAGYKASTGSRRSRELAEDGLISRKEVNGTVFYSHIPQTKVVERVKIEGDRAVMYYETVKV